MKYGHQIKNPKIKFLEHAVLGRWVTPNLLLIFIVFHRDDAFIQPQSLKMDSSFFLPSKTEILKNNHDGDKQVQNFMVLSSLQSDIC